MTATVVVYGGSRTATHCTVDAAAVAGRLLAERGVQMVYGGGSVGPAGACARGAAAAGGRITAITLAHWVEPVEPADELLLATGLVGRTAELERRAGAFLVLPGGIGTWAELFMIWAGRVNGLHDRPIVVLDPDRTLDPLWTAVTEHIQTGAMPARTLSALAIVSEPTAAVELLAQAFTPP